MTHMLGRLLAITIRAVFVSSLLSASIGFAQGTPSDDLARKWYQLARHLEADQQYREAAKAIAKALELNPQSLPMLLTAARIHEQRNACLEAVTIYEKLATVDHRLRTEHLKKIAQLEAKLGRRDKALAAGREVLVAAPGNPEAFELFAQLCFQFGNNAEGLSTLRRAVRMNPSDARMILMLANALAEQFRTAEAIDLLWQAFEKSRDLDGKLSIVQRLTDLTGQLNQFDKMIERLQRLRRETKEPRELTICLAQAHQQAGDEPSAREELESLWSEETRDTQLLQQLVKLCESAADWDDAVKYQRQFNQVAPNRDGELRLARFLAQQGNADAASELFLKTAADETDPERLLKTLDALLQQNRPADVLKLTSRLLAGDVGHVSNVPANVPASPAAGKHVGNVLHESRWELLYREGIARWLTQHQQTADSFEQILKLNLSDDEPDAATKNRRQRETSKPPVHAAVTTSSAATSGVASWSPFRQRLYAVSSARSAIATSAPGVRVARSPFTWMPTDFGQCRAAAQTWLVELAIRESRESEFVEQRRVLWEQRRSEPRVALDWFYLQSARMNGPDIFQAAKWLSELADASVEAKLAYLNATAQRSVERRLAGTTAGGQVFVQMQSNKPAVPLTPSEFEHLLKCLADVQQQSDDATLLLQGWNPSGVLNELRRSGQTVQAKQVYASLLQDATTPARAISLFQETYQTSDVEPLQRLLRLIFPDDEPAGGGPNRTPAGLPVYYTSRDYHAQLLSMVMSAHARQNQWEQQLPSFESFVARTRRTTLPKAVPVRVASPTNTPTATLTLAARQHNYSVFQAAPTSEARNAEAWTFPPPGEFFDRPLFQLLAQMFSNHRTANKLDELCNAFRQRADSAERPDRVYWQLGLSYLEWQRGRQPVALREMEKAIALVPENVSLRFELVGRYEQANEHAKALELLETLLDRPDTPLDHDARRDAEFLVLRLAMRLKNEDRAKLAAERLFSMSLDANMLLEVSQQMEKLGLTDLADAVRNRTRNKAGNQTELLLSLMREYVTKDQTDLASEVAHQILRRAPRSVIQPRQTSVRTVNGTSRVVTMSGFSGGVMVTSNIRLEALKVLKQTGRLADMIAKAEELLSKSPNSKRQLETLAEYLQAAGQTARDPNVAREIAALQQARSGPTIQPVDDVSTIRTQLQRGDGTNAVRLLEALLKQSPNVVVLRWREIDAMFQGAKKSEELLGIIERADRQTIVVAWTVIGSAAGDLIRNSGTRERGIRLLVKALDATPDNLSGLLMLSGVTREVCVQPEIAGHIRKAVIPSGSRPLNDYWQGTRLLATTNRTKNSITAFATILLESCDEPEKLVELEREIDDALKGSITWPGGRVLKGLIQLRRGKHRDAEQTLNDVLEEFKATMPAETREVIAREVEETAVLEPLALRAYESLTNSTPWPVDLSTGPVQRLIRLYVASGQREKARDLLLKNAQQPQSVLSAMATADREVTRLTEIAKQLRALDFDVEAARVCRDTLGNREFFAALDPRTAKLVRERLDDSLSRVVTKFDADKLFEFLIGRTVAAANDPAIAWTHPAITDWVLFVESSESSESPLRSVIAGVLQQTAQESVAATLGMRVRLSQLRKQHPNDLSLATLSLLMTVAEKSDPLFSDESLVELRQLRTQLAALPLPDVAAGGPPVATQVALWLIARECLTAAESKSLADSVKSELRETSGILGDRAVFAAFSSGHSAHDKALRVALLSEWSRFSLDRGDTDAAEKCWHRLLEALGGTPGGPANAAAPVTPERFEHSVKIAALAAQHDKLRLSLKAFAEALACGPPMEAFEWERLQASGPMASGFGPNPREDAQFCNVSKTAYEQIAKLLPTWRKLGLTDEQLYEWLLPIVLPESRREEVFLYSPPVPLYSVDGARGLGTMLVQSAVTCGKTEALRERLEVRAAQPRGELAARVLLTQLAVAQNQRDEAQRQLEQLQKILNPTSRRSVIEAVTQAVASARRLEQPLPAIKPLLDDLTFKSKANGF